MPPAAPSSSPLTRPLWWAGGVLSLAVGIVGVFVPLLPTVPFVLLAAWCFSRGCARCEAWLLAHPRFGPPVRAWRERRAVPAHAKALAVTMMALGSALAWSQLPDGWRWLPAAACAGVAAWMLRLPNR